MIELEDDCPEKLSSNNKSVRAPAKIGKDLSEFRRSMGLNQSAFWARFENGYPLPKLVAILFDAIYIKGVDFRQLA